MPLDPWPDFARFVARLRRPPPPARGLFAAGRDLCIARAPGRLDVMGGIADYSGALVLELPLAAATFAAVQRSDDGELRLVSLGVGACELHLDRLAAMDWDEAAAYFAADPPRQWAAYAAGAVVALARAHGARFAGGARVLIASDVPRGAGVASSAAVEVACLQAIAGAFGIALEPLPAALLCQQIENRIARAPCGAMDQVTAMCGRADTLLALLCQPAELQEPIALPPSLAVFGIDSGVRHAVSGADYATVRAAAFMGYRILAAHVGLEVERESAGVLVRVRDPQWCGYLANVGAAAYLHDFAHALPPTLRGDEFLARYGGTTDAATRVDPQRGYPVRAATAHPILEHARVCAFADLLRQDVDSGGADRDALGELMLQAHASYNACGLGTAATDLIVELVQQAGAARGVYGARITGGGSGGTVAVLADLAAAATVRAIAAEYARRAGCGGRVFSGSSPGAAAFGTRVVALP